MSLHQRREGECNMINQIRDKIRSVDSVHDGSQCFIVVLNILPNKIQSRVV
jgi:hypothetical protein